MPRRMLGAVGGPPPGGPADVSPPGWLSQPATAHWRALAPLTAPGMLTENTAAAFALMCTNLATWVDADQLVNEAGILIASAGNDLIPNPALPIRDRAEGSLSRWLAMFGLTPAAQPSSKPATGRAMPHLVER